jgi:glycosyltransferase involved in cell wall biosynthesis
LVLEFAPFIAMTLHDPSPTPDPVVSVLMPVYNAERFLEQTLQSILAQTFTDFEFIIIDDGSTDSSRSILESHAARDRRVRLVSRPNTGYVVALNEAIGMARGRYLARMDADDVALPVRLERQVQFLDEHPDHVCVGAVCAFIDERGRFLRYSMSVFGHEANQRELMRGSTTLIHPTWMMRRDAVERVGPYDPSLMPAEDIDLLLRLSETGKVDNLPEPLLKYRMHDQSVSSRRHHQQLAHMKMAVERAAGRRGVPVPELGLSPFRAQGGRRSVAKLRLTYGWWAFQSGRRSTALLYAAKALRLVPWHGGAWDLLACSLLKPMPRPSYPWTDVCS